jgi:hypothetical protein
MAAKPPDLRWQEDDFPRSRGGHGPIIFAGMDREQIAREVRRRQAKETLDFEREREKTIQEQIELVIVEIEGPKVDAAAFERMSAEDAAVVREELVVSDDDGGGFFERDDVIMLDDEVDEQAEELARLNDELDDCRRRQRAFEAYLGALGS